MDKIKEVQQILNNHALPTNNGGFIRDSLDGNKFNEIARDIVKLFAIPDVMHSYTPNYLHFRVNGAGKIQITEDYQYRCGGEEGFLFGVEWGKHGFAGGVLPKDEAKRLAEYILNALK